MPPYSPKLNPIEGLWGWLSVIYNVFFQSVKAIIEAVDTSLAMISKDPMTIIDRLLRPDLKAPHTLYFSLPLFVGAVVTFRTNKSPVNLY